MNYKLLIFSFLLLIGFQQSNAQSALDKIIIQDTLLPVDSISIQKEQKKKADKFSSTAVSINKSNEQLLKPTSKNPREIIPKKSAMYAALVPGLGQIYNRSYWKVPIVYGLVAVSTYFVIYNTNGYNEFRSIYANRYNNINTDKYYANYPQIEQIQYRRDSYKKQLDLTYMLSALGYLLQVVDANVDAHLKGFDISEDLSMQFRPSFQMTPMGVAPGVGCVINLK